ncbi:hypothetical protein [Streptomyces sp. NPDC006355]|uniref:hypothetical protein n=1 Tax=Streptomyces sp. NPDC006355 TaxID=3156758 RepID=UPI0033BE1B82
MAKYCGTAITGDDGYGWVRETEWGKRTGRWVREYLDEDGTRYVLEKRKRNPKDGTMDTGWYLYDSRPSGGFFGEWCSSRILDAVDEANRLIAEQE